SASRVMGTTARYVSRHSRRFSRSSLSHAARRFSKVEKSRNPRSTGFFSFNTSRSPSNTHEMWVSMSSRSRDRSSISVATSYPHRVGGRQILEGHRYVGVLYRTAPQVQRRAMSRALHHERVHPEPGQLAHVGQGCVAQGVGAGTPDGARHVRHAVVHHV